MLDYRKHYFAESIRYTLVPRLLLRLLLLNFLLVGFFLKNEHADKLLIIENSLGGLNYFSALRHGNGEHTVGWLQKTKCAVNGWFVFQVNEHTEYRYRIVRRNGLGLCLRNDYRRFAGKGYAVNENIRLLRICQRLKHGVHFFNMGYFIIRKVRILLTKSPRNTIHFCDSPIQQ